MLLNKSDGVDDEDAWQIPKGQFSEDHKDDDDENAEPREVAPEEKLGSKKLKPKTRFCIIISLGIIILQIFIF